jgi:hypothetical protein
LHFLTNTGRGVHGLDERATAAGKAATAAGVNAAESGAGKQLPLGRTTGGGGLVRERDCDGDGGSDAKRLADRAAKFRRSNADAVAETAPPRVGSERQKRPPVQVNV